MTRIVFLNGDYLPEDEAKISIFDRAVNFGDAIYEVAGVLDGKLIDFEHHMQRYFNSLEKLSIESPLEQTQILEAFRRLVELNQVDEGLVYMQVTRGVAERDFVWPEDIKPNVFMFTQPKASIENSAAETGITLASTADIRWARRDIKSVNLLAQVLAKQAAHNAGAYEALMVDAEGFVTECGSTSFFIVKDDLVLTRPLSNDILPGVTRRAVVALCNSHGLRLVENRFTLDDAKSADEAFISGASTYILPVVKIDDQEISAGIPGELSRRLREIYIGYARASLI
ncbi:MAG: D-amino acid aminotransferase [Gammaproteobacteria bacterium]|nr:D-amino acid aminotransferase [Gammaproteobacteria bacterium]